MLTPSRLQLSRRKGFNLQALSLATNGLPAVNVARPNKWGNPYRIGEYYRGIDDDGKLVGHYRCTSTKEAVQCFREMMTNPRWRYQDDILKELSGKNLACWCKFGGEPCHADVLLALAGRSHDAMPGNPP